MSGISIPLVLFTVGPVAWVMVTWIRARHGYPLSDDKGRAVYPAKGADSDQKIALLSTENEKLIGRIGRLEERIAVMERIVTDPSHATARAIEELR